MDILEISQIVGSHVSGNEATASSNIFAFLSKYTDEVFKRNFEFIAKFLIDFDLAIKNSDDAKRKEFQSRIQDMFTPLKKSSIDENDVSDLFQKFEIILNVMIMESKKSTELDFLQNKNENVAIEDNPINTDSFQNFILIPTNDEKSLMIINPKGKVLVVTENKAEVLNDKDAHDAINSLPKLPIIEISKEDVIKNLQTHNVQYDISDDPFIKEFLNTVNDGNNQNPSNLPASAFANGIKNILGKSSDNSAEIKEVIEEASKRNRKSKNKALVGENVDNTNMVHPLIKFLKRVESRSDEKYKKAFTVISSKDEENGTVTKFDGNDYLIADDASVTYKTKTTSNKITADMETNNMTISHRKSHKVENKVIVDTILSTVDYMNDKGQVPFELSINFKTEDYLKSVVWFLYDFTDAQLAKKSKEDINESKNILAKIKSFNFGGVKISKDELLKSTSPETAKKEFEDKINKIIKDKEELDKKKKDEEFNNASKQIDEFIEKQRQKEERQLAALQQDQNSL